MIMFDSVSGGTEEAESSGEGVSSTGDGGVAHPKMAEIHKHNSITRLDIAHWTYRKTKTVLRFHTFDYLIAEFTCRYHIRAIH